uniref:Uncharacterized protein n=1 Tax=Rhizophora mucronata TaxID=61149 RepID=A0A2P2PE67_RHIMU
MFDFGSLKHP